MFNKVIMLGRLTRDVELKYLPNTGTAATTIGLASGRTYKKQDGTEVNETCFIDVKLFGRTAEVVNQYLKKGSPILIEGRLVLESWTDAKTGDKRNKHSIVAERIQMLSKDMMIASPSDIDSDPTQDYPNSDTQSDSYDNPTQDYPRDNNIEKPAESAKNPQVDVDEDEIPF